MSTVNVTPIDIPITNLEPVRKRTASKEGFDRIAASIRSVGLIEPLIVYEQEGTHFILDGYLRYQILMELGIETVPCYAVGNLDLYTHNRQVNYISNSQRMRMIRKALQVVEEGDLKKALGLTSLSKPIPKIQKENLDPEILTLVKNETIAQNAAKHLIYVLPDRQREIIEVARQANDFSAAFLRAQVLKTPESQRTKRKWSVTPWEKNANRKQQLADKLQDAEKHYDFYQGLYRQYVADLVKLVIYVRQVINNDDCRAYLADHHPDDLAMFQNIIEQSGESLAG